jgi:hypothetical protein
MVDSICLFFAVYCSLDLHEQIKALHSQKSQSLLHNFEVFLSGYFGENFYGWIKCQLQKSQSSLHNSLTGFL